MAEEDDFPAVLGEDMFFMMKFRTRGEMQKTGTVVNYICRHPLQLCIVNIYNCVTGITVVSFLTKKKKKKKSVEGTA